jgi:hypothetical protein
MIIIVFFSLLPDGSKSLPKRSTQDGKFHVPGQHEMIDKSAFKFIHNVSVPALRAAGSKKKIIFSPLLRYGSGKCCDAPDHLTNVGGKKKLP